MKNFYNTNTLERKESENYASDAVRPACYYYFICLAIDFYYLNCDEKSLILAVFSKVTFWSIWVTLKRIAPSLLNQSFWKFEYSFIYSTAHTYLIYKNCYFHTKSLKIKNKMNTCSIFGGLGHMEYVSIDKRNYETHFTDHSLMCYQFGEWHFHNTTIIWNIFCPIRKFKNQIFKGTRPP